ncbi:hypothetical protein ABPG75_000964 [Micractinium tetrahymenae]
MEDEFEGLSYRELQVRCREKGLRATGKAEELLQRLLDNAAGEPASPAPATVRKAAKTPRTSRKAAAAAPEPAGPTPAADKAALLRAAASTPLPPRSEEKLAAAEQKKWVHAQADDAGGEDEDQEEEAEAPSRRRSAGSARRRSSQSGGGAAPSSARRGRSPSATRPRATTTGLTTPLFLVLLVTAAAAAFAALAVPYCQHHDCAELARNLPELAGEAAAAGWGAARARALAGADAVQERAQQLLAKLSHGSAGPPRPPACQFDAGAALHAIMPAGEAYQGLKAAATQLLGSQGAEPADKPAVALFACAAEAGCHSAVRELDQAAADSERCVLHLDGRHLGDDKGALQGQLADFLRATPTGLVLLRRIDQMSPDLLPVLINALSEHGAFQQDGRPVATKEATFLLTSLMPSTVFDLMADEIRFKQEAKTQMVVDFALRSADKEAAKAQAAALRRRIDLVIPVGVDPFVEEAEAGAQHTADAAAYEEAVEIAVEA